MDTRLEWQWEHPHDEGNTSGFHGRYLNLMVNGQLNSQFSFSWRQRLNKFHDAEDDVFNATDWIYLDWHPTANFSLAGGKQVVLIGGYEYDRAPIDIYYASLFWNNIACYQMGASASLTTDNRQHTVTFQVCNSPYRMDNEDWYAFNLYWSGKMRHYSTLWSVNMMKYDSKHYANFIALGNRLDYGPFYCELDLMNRYSLHQRFFFEDYSVIGKVAYLIDNKVRLFAKGGYEHYRLELGNRQLIEKPFYGGGLEVFPIKGRENIRLHAVADVNHGALGERNFEIILGVKWRVDLFKYTAAR